MSDNKADLVNILAGVMAACANEGDYDPVEDYIRDPFCRRVDAACGQALAEIARLREIESQAKAAGFIGPDGKVRKVLGDLPVTRDGCIVGDGSRIFFADRSRFGGEEIVLEWDVSGAGDNIPTDVFYSTREAAEAAREGNK